MLCTIFTRDGRAILEELNEKERNRQLGHYRELEEARDFEIAIHRAGLTWEDVSHTVDHDATAEYVWKKGKWECIAAQKKAKKRTRLEERLDLRVERDGDGYRADAHALPGAPIVGIHETATKAKYLVLDWVIFQLVNESQYAPILKNLLR
jgi:hypothetical protein